jgi:lysozyme
MKTSTEGILWIKQRESCRLVAYRDEAGVWTIGYGHTKTAKEGMQITATRAEQLLAIDLLDYEQAVVKYVTPQLRQCEFDALVSFSFNEGAGALDPKTCTAIRELNAEHRAGFARNLVRYCKVKKAGVLTYDEGLAMRRSEELYQFMGGAR